MKPISDIDEIRRIELGILEDVDAFCKARGISYFLCGGTLIGAIRHKGFIPWDDDIDIGMLRPDYDRFIAEYESPCHAVRSLETDSYVDAFAKVVDTRTIVVEDDFAIGGLGIWIDVFPFDGAPGPDFDPHAERDWRWTKKLLRFRNLPFFRPGYTAKQRLGLLLSLPVRLISNRCLAGRLRRIAARYSVAGSPFVGCLVSTYPCRRELLPRAAFDGETPVEFEGRTFPAMSGWREYLASLYGDYMTPPPPEKRKSTHRFRAWWK